MTAKLFLTVLLLAVPSLAADNQLTAADKKEGWLLLFDGKSLDNWMAGDGQPSKRPAEFGSINPHKAGRSMLVYTKQFSDFVLALDFKITPHCNNGVFVRTYPLTDIPNQGIGYYGIEVQFFDSKTTNYHDTGAFYDLVKPTKNAMKPPGQWNHVKITCNRNLLDVVLYGEQVNHMDLAQWNEPNKRPDGSAHKFDCALKDQRRGYIGVQDHGFDRWFKNIKLKPISRSKSGGGKSLRPPPSCC